MFGLIKQKLGSSFRATREDMSMKMALACALLWSFYIRTISLEKPREEFDKIVFEALGLTEEEQLKVCRAVLELVKNRLLKARSR